jgi:ribosome-binding ATPase YchF (GTP1/OBG family)
LEVSKKIIEELAERISVTDTERFAKELRKLSKPMVYAANKIDLSDSQQNFERLKEKYKNMVPTSAEAEIALKKAAEKELINYLPDGNFEIIDTSKLESSQLKVLEFIKKNVVEKYGSTGIQTCLNKAVFEFLNYVAVYPVEDMNKLSDRYGNKLPDVHLMPKGSTALDLAFKIHTDIGNKFICAIDAKTKRKLSADYQLKNNDVVEIAFSK